MLVLAGTLIFVPLQDPVLITGFRGSVISGIFGGMMFLFLGLYLNEEIERLIQETHDLIAAREARDANQRKVEQLLRFLRNEQYHDARFPDLKTSADPAGLDYTIEPVRDAAGRPRRMVTEMDEAYVVRVRGPAHREVRDPESLAEYENAPIRTKEYYFCRFYNSDWHMGQDSIGWKWHRFYLSGKVGPVEHGISANEFIGITAERPEGLRLLFALLHDPQEGTVLTGSGGGNPVEVFAAENGTLLAQFYDSPLKPLRVERDAAGRAHIAIEDSEGHFPGPARANFMRVLMEELRKAGAVTEG